jgi:hypothetical protein
MGLKDKFSNEGSYYAYGATPLSPTNGGFISNLNQDTLLIGFKDDKSGLTGYDGATPDPNPLSTVYSSLHYNYDTESPGYSTVGPDSPQYTTTVLDYQLYNNGVPYVNPLPPPTILEPNDGNGPDPKFKSPFSPKPGNRYQDSSFK